MSDQEFAFDFIIGLRDIYYTILQIEPSNL